LNKSVNTKEYGHDRSGWVSGKNINLEMVKGGFAEVYRGDPAPGQDLAPYWKAEGKGKPAKKERWVQGAKYMRPRDWRKLKTR